MRAKNVTAALVGLLITSGLALLPLATAADAAPVVAPTTSPSGVFKVTPISWKRCKDPSLRSVKGKCGFLSVPLDHANPAGPTIQLAVSRVRHTRSPYKGAVFTNPGGPGAGGTYLAGYGQYVPKKVGLNYDWYGMDPRGSGESKPAPSCDSKYFRWDREPYRPSTQKILDYWIARTDKYAADCGTSSSAALLQHMKTTDIVEDFELFRQAIGESQVTFYGFSYGTYIAQVWATLHPTSLKALILDGVVDPSRVWYQANLDQDYAFGKAFDKFFAWIGKYHRNFGLGKTRKQVERRITRLEKQLAKRPADGRLGPSELADAILVAGYINLAWPDVAAAVAELANRDNSKPLQQLYRRQNPTGKGADNGYAMYLATECTDVAWPKDWNIWAADNNAADQASPFFAWANAWFNAPCRNWPVAPSTPVKVSGASFTGPVLLANETFDAATPFSGALAVRALFPTAVLIEGKGGTSHAVTLSGISCTDNAIAKVLKSGKLPARKAGSGADKKCPGLGAPTLGNQDAHRAPAARVLADALGRAAFLG